MCGFERVKTERRVVCDQRYASCLWEKEDSKAKFQVYKMSQPLVSRFGEGPSTVPQPDFQAANEIFGYR